MGTQIFDKCDPKKQKNRQQLIICMKWFSRKKKIKRCRKESAEFLKFKEKLGLNPYKITYDEQDIISALQVAFEGEIIHT